MTREMCGCFARRLVRAAWRVAQSTVASCVRRIAGRPLSAQAAQKRSPLDPDECDPSAEDLAGAQELWNDWASSLEQQAHQYDEAERQSCPPSYSAEEEAQFAYAPPIQTCTPP